MKKPILLLLIAAMISVTAFSQTQRTNRTNSRSHYPPDTTRPASSRMEIQTDADRNNPPADNTKNTQQNTNQNVNKPNNNNNTNPNNKR